MSKTISGAFFRKMVISGANALEENKEYVNSLNVFPVPDGDTGTNMSLTMRSAMKEVNMCTNNNLDSLGEAIGKGALKGARGNSGVILSQILKGFTSVIAKEKATLEKINFNALTEEDKKTLTKLELKGDGDAFIRMWEMILQKDFVKSAKS